MSVTWFAILRTTGLSYLWSFEFVQHHHRQQQRQIQNRRIKQLSRARNGQVAGELEGEPKKSQSQEQGARQINRPRQFEQEGAQTHRQQNQRVAEGLASGAPALR